MERVVVGWGRHSGGVASAVGRWGKWLWVGGGIPAVSLVPRSTAGYRPSSLRDEGRERRTEDGRSDEREDGRYAVLA
jgi:hypothetical protein